MRQLLPFVVVAAALAVAPAGRADAQGVPGQLSFTARLTDDRGPVNGLHTFSLKLFDAPSAGSEVWAEVRENVPVEAGLVYLSLGTETLLDATVLNGQPRYLAVSVDGVELGPRLPLYSVPYAIRAGVASEAERVGGLEPGDLITSVNAGGGLVGGGSSGAVSLAADFGGSGGSVQVARADHNHDGVYMPAVAQTCPPGAYMAGIAANGTPVCADLNAALRTYVNNNCYVYLGWRDDCNGCANPPTKYGRVAGNDCGVSGSNGTCIAANLDGVVVNLAGVNPDGDVGDDDKFHIGFRCF